MVVIHSEPGIPWHASFASKMRRGLKRIGIDSKVTTSRGRESDVAILLGTTLWRNVEATGKYLLVDRASFGDPEFVQLVWDGHGRRGNHNVPLPIDSARWKAMGCRVSPWREGGHRVVLCGQVETWSPKYVSPESWYSTVNATHFRSHPSGTNPTGLPRAATWDDCEVAITLNSSVGVDAVLNGIATVTMDEAAMSWDVTGHIPTDRHMPDRRPWLEWLAWTQWHHDEIEQGEPIKHLFEAI